MGQLITEFTKCSDRSFLHDGEAPQANMLREHSGYDNSRILYVIVRIALSIYDLHRIRRRLGNLRVSYPTCHEICTL